MFDERVVATVRLFEWRRRRRADLDPLDVVTGALTVAAGAAAVDDGEDDDLDVSNDAGE